MGKTTTTATLRSKIITSFCCVKKEDRKQLACLRVPFPYTIGRFARFLKVDPVNFFQPEAISLNENLSPQTNQPIICFLTDRVFLRLFYNY